MTPRPDAETQRSLERGLRELVFGEYLEAAERWLVWHGRGPLGPTRYACPAHRGDLVAYVREHYGTIARASVEDAAVRDEPPLARHRAGDRPRRALVDAQVGPAVVGRQRTS